MKQTQEREKRRVRINIKDAPYEKVVRIMHLFIEPYSYNLIELFNCNNVLNENEVLSKTRDKNYYGDEVESNLTRLVNNKILLRKRKTYSLNVPIVDKINKVLDLLGKNARDI